MDDRRDIGGAQSTTARETRASRAALSLIPEQDALVDLSWVPDEPLVTKLCLECELPIWCFASEEPPARCQVHT